jgi:hypothetical protein
MHQFRCGLAEGGEVGCGDGSKERSAERRRLALTNRPYGSTPRVRAEL